MRESYYRRLSRILGCALAVVGALLVAVLIFDALHGNIGYIRYAEPCTGAASGISRLAEWFAKIFGA